MNVACDVMQMTTQMISDLRCVKAGYYKQWVKDHVDGASMLLWDIIELADAAGCEHMEVLLDERQHPIQSLLSPKLALCQGPALCIKLHGMLPDHVFIGSAVCVDNICNLLRGVVEPAAGCEHVEVLPITELFAEAPQDSCLCCDC